MGDIAEQQRRLEELDRRLAEEHAAQVLRAREDFAAFFEFVMRDETTGNRVKLGNIHYMWFEFIAVCWRLGLFPWILAPFGSGKTNILIALSLFLIGRDPRIRIKIISANDDIAGDRVGSIRNYIMQSEAYREVFPNVKPSQTDEWTRRSFFVQRATFGAKDATVAAVGATSTIMGSRADFNIYDDMNDVKNTLMEPKMRAKIWLNYLMYHSRRELGDGITSSGGTGCGIMTRWHREDVFGMIARNPNMLTEYGFLIQSAESCEYLDSEILLGKVPEDPDAPPPAKRTRIQTALEQYERGLLSGAVA